ncbi:MAG: YIP1 family protein [Clostridiales bacterium]|nr:YIP1 family protein [Clostridiales bacterium]
MEDTKYMFYVLLHPFDGFYEVKFRGKKNYIIATVVLVLFGIIGILDYQYTGFIFNDNPLQHMNSIKVFFTTLFPLLLFLISNWSITTLFDGSGSMSDIYIVICYSLVPKIIFDIIGIIFSNVIIKEEASLLYSFTAIGTIWFCFLVFCGLCVIHEYSASTNILTLLASFISAIIIVFLCMLYITLMGRLFGFFATAFNELIKRW